MQDRQNDHTIVRQEEEHAIRKPFDQRAANIPMDGRKGERLLSDRLEHSLDLTPEVAAKASQPIVVLVTRSGQIRFCLRTDQHGPTHVRPKSLSRTSDHGAPALGSR